MEEEDYQVQLPLVLLSALGPLEAPLSRKTRRQIFFDVKDIAEHVNMTGFVSDDLDWVSSLYPCGGFPGFASAIRKISRLSTRLVWSNGDGSLWNHLIQLSEQVVDPGVFLPENRLTKLSMREVGLTSVHCRWLGQALVHNGTLQSLDVGRNQLGSEGVSGPCIWKHSMCHTMGLTVRNCGRL